MICPKCKRYTLPEEHLSSSGKLNKLCYKCLKKPKVKEVNYCDDLLEILNIVELFPLCFILINSDNIDVPLEELGKSLCDILLIEKGYKFR
jgi:hypothetical protein